MMGETSMLATSITLEFSTSPESQILEYSFDEQNGLTHEGQAGGHHHQTDVVKRELCIALNPFDHLGHHQPRLDTPVKLGDVPRLLKCRSCSVSILEELTFCTFYIFLRFATLLELRVFWVEGCEVSPSTVSARSPQ